MTASNDNNSRRFRVLPSDAAAFFQELTEEYHYVVWVFDWVAKCITYASPAYERVWGRSTESLYQRREEWRESLHPDDRDNAQAAFTAMAESDRSAAHEYRILRPDGTIRWIADRGYAIRDVKGNVIRIMGIAEDITERRLAELETRRRQKFLESVLYHAPDAIVTLDARHRVLDWNPGAEKIFGYTRAETIGRNLDDLVTRQDVAAEATSFTRQVLSGKTLRPIETVRYGKDGEAMHVIAAGSPIFVDNELRGVVAIYTDISILKKAEKDLRESEERFRSVYQTIPDPVAVIRMADNRCVDINRAFSELSGYSPQAIIGTTSKEISLWRHSAQRDRMLTGLTTKGIVSNLEAEFSTRDGRIVTGLVSAKLLTLQEEPHALVITRDISQIKAAEQERKILETQLRQAQKLEAIGTLAGGIAHDFNNLLMGIQGRNSLMMADLSSDHPLWDHLRGTQSYVRSAVDLTKQLLGFARGGKYEARPINLNDLVVDSARMFGRTHKEISIQTELAPDLKSVEVDPGQIEQVLLNLYVNALQAMPAGGDLYLKTANITISSTDPQASALAPGIYAKLSVTDTGIGMDAATRERIFEPFFTTREMGRGTGLGLASTFGILRNHDGHITVYSEKGHGTTFNVYLPVTEKPVYQPKTKEQDIHPGGETILLVDDERMILDVGRKMLEKLGYHVKTAGSGKEAVAIYSAERETINLVILDMIMPTMGGGPTFDALKKVDPNIRVLLSSGYSLNGQAADILQRGCLGFIQKPFDLGTLSQKLREILGT
jgi:PAS domain S-box-containing protein